MKENKSFYEKLSFSLFLIFLGSVFLLNNFGYIHFSNFFPVFLTYWPLLIILAGFKIVLKTFSFGKVIEIVIDIVLYLLIVFVLLTYKGNGMAASWFSKQSQINNYEYSLSPEEPIEQIKYNLNLGASKFSISDTNSLELFKVIGSYYNNKPSVQLNLPGVADEKSSIDFTYSPTPIVLGVGYSQSNFDFQVSNAPKQNDFDIKIGATEGEVDLEKISVNQFDVAVGAGNLKNSFNSDISTPSEMSIKVGAGNVDVYLPISVKIVLNYSVGAGNITINEKSDVKEFSGLAKTGRYTSEGTFTDEIKINATVGAGSINIYHE